MQAVVVTAQTTLDPNRESMQLALFNSDGSAKAVMQPSATQATFAGADITALKVELNAFLVKLKAAGIVLP
jgi:hypothetical protein